MRVGVLGEGFALEVSRGGEGWCEYVREGWEEGFVRSRGRRGVVSGRRGGIYVLFPEGYALRARQYLS